MDGILNHASSCVSAPSSTRLALWNKNIPVKRSTLLKRSKVRVMIKESYVVTHCLCNIAIQTRNIYPFPPTWSPAPNFCVTCHLVFKGAEKKGKINIIRTWRDSSKINIYFSVFRRYFFSPQQRRPQPHSLAVCLHRTLQNLEKTHLKRSSERRGAEEIEKDGRSADDKRNRFITHVIMTRIQITL